MFLVFDTQDFCLALHSVGTEPKWAHTKQVPYLPIYLTCPLKFFYAVYNIKTNAISKIKNKIKKYEFRAMRLIKGLAYNFNVRAWILYLTPHGASRSHSIFPRYCQVWQGYKGESQYYQSILLQEMTLGFSYFFPADICLDPPHPTTTPHPFTSNPSN